MDARALPFAKGHGTGNDFVVLPDPDGLLDPSPSLVASLCDRRFGIGGDGVLRVVRTNKVPEVADRAGEDRKSTRLNSSHVKISYAVFCLKKKTQTVTATTVSTSARLNTTIMSARRVML